MVSELVIEDSGATLDAPVVKGTNAGTVGLETTALVGATEPELLPVPSTAPDASGTGNTDTTDVKTTGISESSRLNRLKKLASLTAARVATRATDTLLNNCMSKINEQSMPRK